MTTEQVREKVRELTRDLSDDELEQLVADLYAVRSGWTLPGPDLIELDDRSAAMDRGEAVRVDDIERFIDDLDPANQ